MKFNFGIDHAEMREELVENKERWYIREYYLRMVSRGIYPHDLHSKYDFKSSIENELNANITLKELAVNAILNTNVVSFIKQSIDNSPKDLYHVFLKCALYSLNEFVVQYIVENWPFETMELAKYFHDVYSSLLLFYNTDLNEYTSKINPEIYKWLFIGANYTKMIVRLFLKNARKPNCKFSKLDITGLPISKKIIAKLIKIVEYQLDQFDKKKQEKRRQKDEKRKKTTFICASCVAENKSHQVAAADENDPKTSSSETNSSSSSPIKDEKKQSSESTSSSSEILPLCDIASSDEDDEEDEEDEDDDSDFSDSEMDSEMSNSDEELTSDDDDDDALSFDYDEDSDEDEDDLEEDVDIFDLLFAENYNQYSSGSDFESDESDEEKYGSGKKKKEESGKLLCTKLTIKLDLDETYGYDLKRLMKCLKVMEENGYEAEKLMIELVFGRLNVAVQKRSYSNPFVKTCFQSVAQRMQGLNLFFHGRCEEAIYSISLIPPFINIAELNLTALELPSTFSVIINSPPIKDLIAKTLSSLVNLRRLRIDGIGLRDTLAKILDPLKQPLEYLSLHSCHLNANDLNYLAKSHHATNLKNLSLGGNKWTENADWLTLVHVLQKCARTLQVLELVSNSMTYEAHMRLLDEMLTMPHLKQFVQIDRFTFDNYLKMADKLNDVRSFLSWRISFSTDFYEQATKIKSKYKFKKFKNDYIMSLKNKFDTRSVCITINDPDLNYILNEII